MLFTGWLKEGVNKSNNYTNYMKNTNNSKIVFVALAVMLVFGVIAVMPKSANASYGYNGDYHGYNDVGSSFYESGSYSGGMYVQGLAGPQSPWYPSIVVPIESQEFYMEQTWRRYGFSSSDFKHNSSSNSYYSASNSGNIRGGYGY